jgi:tetratricopeptide (TPR) repeat protein
VGLIVKLLAGLLILIVARCASAQSGVIAIDVTGEHRVASGDTPDSAKQLARVDAQRRAWQTAVTQLLDSQGIKALPLTPRQVEAFTAVLLELEEPPSPNASAAPRGLVQVRLRGRLDASEVVQRIALLRKDQDVTYDLEEAWVEMVRLHQQLARETELRAGLPNDKASALAQNQLKTLTLLNAKHLSARASMALARTEPSAIGGRASSTEGRQQAKQLADAALALSPDSPDAHDVLGDFFLDALEPEAAEVEFRKARLVDAESSSGRTKLAEALRLQGQFDEAIAELRAALRIDPSSARAHSGVALALRAQDNVAESITEYREAIRLDPDLIDAHNGLAVVLATQGKLEEAVSEFREIVRIDPDSAIGYYNLAYALADLDRDVESAAALREVIRINPNHYNARYNLGELFRLEAKYDESVKQFREYLRLAPDTPQNRRNIERAKSFVEKFTEP